MNFVNELTNKLIEREAPVDSVQIKSTNLKLNFSCFLLCVFPWCKENPQIVMSRASVV